ncbi:MAG: undecaprenyl-diphosphatase UppP [Deltaproteobacteria bacterium]|nr:undecaprenyl-diphosphatase UppP [Deltaproteobacteria bacterium]
MEYLFAALMGIIQGLTEFIPVSSTAHLRILPELLGQKDLGAAFTAIIQIGTLFSLIIYFWKDVYKLLVDFSSSLIKKNFKNPNFLLSLYIIVGTIPIIIFGILFKRLIENEFRSLLVVSLSLIIFAALLLISEWIGKKEKGIENMNLKDAILIGLAQAFALIPGASRSGVTICMALFLGYKREISARFSFLMSIPSVLAAAIFEANEIFNSDLGYSIASVIIATLFSLVSGIIAIEFLLRFLVSHKINIFAYYRILLGTIILIFFV